MTVFRDQILDVSVCNEEGDFSLDEVHQIVYHKSLISTSVLMYQLSQHLALF